MRFLCMLFDLSKLFSKICLMACVSTTSNQGSASAVTYPVSAISSLAVGGRIENMVNVWREHGFSAGDDLTFHLEYLPIASRLVWQTSFAKACITNITSVFVWWCVCTTKPGMGGLNSY